MRRTIDGSCPLAFLFLTLTLSACYQPEEGCIDINATNFQVNADRPCSGCCEYPLIAVDFQHKVVLSDTVYNLVYEDSVYFDGAGNPFYIRDIRFYFSEIRLVRPDGEWAGVTDTILLPVEQPGGIITYEEIEDNFALVNPGIFGQKIMGTLRSNGRFKRVAFSLGVPGIANNADPGAFPVGHPLADPSMYLGPEAGRLFYRIELFRIEAPADTIETRLDISGPEHLRSLELPVGQPDGFFLDPGFNPKVQFRIDYLTWFQDVDLVADDQEVIIQKIVKNATKSFSVINVTAD